jgi:DNA polymerase
MLAAIDLDRSACYITLIAPRQRVAGPAPAQSIAADRALTAAHLRLARPRLLLLLGQSAAIEIGGTTGAIGSLRGQWVDAPGLGMPALASFNPAYLLRRPEQKARAWVDLLALRARMRP